MRSILFIAPFVWSACLEPAPIQISDPSVATIETQPMPTESTVTTEDSEPPDGQCGDVSHWDLHIEGAVVDWQERPFEGIDVELQDRGWNPGTVMGTATTDADGMYAFDVSQLTSVEDCWGTLLDYVLVGTDGDLVAEEGVNPQLYNAIVDGSLEVDLYTVPLVLE